MSLSIQEIETGILTLSQPEQLKVIDFIESLKAKFPKKSLSQEHLQSVQRTTKPLTMDLFKGKIQMQEDFNEPLPDSFWLEGQL